MKKLLGVAVAAVAALALMGQAADAGQRKHRHHRHHHHHHLHHHVFHQHADKRVALADTVTTVGSAVAFFELTDWSWNNGWNQRHGHSGVTTAGAFALTSVGCIAVAPIVGTAFARRPLTHREVHTMSANCVLPILGGLLVSAAYDRNPHWEQFDKPARPVRVVRKKRR